MKNNSSLYRLGMGVFFMCVACVPLSADVSDESPSLYVVEKPAGKYRLGEPIFYRLRIDWPQSAPLENLRLQDPEIQLSNLELASVGQESVSESVKNEVHKTVSQLLTFRFKSLKPGPARIDRLKLRWKLENESASIRLTVPAIDLQITGGMIPKSAGWIFCVLAVASGAGICILMRTRSQKMNRTKIESAQPAPSLEESILSQIREAFALFKRNGKRTQLIESFNRLFRHYAAEKLNWHPKQSGYNELLKRAEEHWPKKEAQELGQIMAALERQRFSGAGSENDLMALYQRLTSFIERKISSTHSEETWKPPSNK